MQNELFYAVVSFLYDLLSPLLLALTWFLKTKEISEINAETHLVESDIMRLEEENFLLKMAEAFIPPSPRRNVSRNASCNCSRNIDARLSC